MDSTKISSQQQERIIDDWVQALLDSYPAEGGKFFGKGTNEFSNPVGSTFKKSIAVLFDLLIGEEEIVGGKDAVDGIVRIRAVQGFLPSQALSPFFAIKKIVKTRLGEDGFDEKMDKRLEQLLFLAFDQYMACRETLWQHKANSLYDRTHRLLEKNRLLVDAGESEKIGGFV